jgi:hypothetical protein
MLRDFCEKKERNVGSDSADPFKFDVNHREAALDEGLCESFPASDPVAVSISRVATRKSMNCLDRLSI